MIILLFTKTCQDQKSLHEGPRGKLQQNASDIENLCGSYLVPWSTVERICGLDCQLPWLQRARMTIVDAQLCDCRHEPQKHRLVVAFDCYYPKQSGEEISLADYGRVKSWLQWCGDKICLRLCSQCNGYDLDGDYLTGDLVVDMLTTQARWDRWWYLSTAYGIDLTPRVSSGLEYAVVYTDVSGSEFPFEPGQTTKTQQHHWHAGTHYQQKSTKNKFLPPAQFHAAFWIFSFLHELLVELYVSLGFNDKDYKDVKHWAKNQAMKLQPYWMGWKQVPHNVLQSLSPMCQRVERLDDFIWYMQEHLTEQAQGATKGTNVFGFKNLQADRVDVATLAVKLAHVVAELLPRTRFIKVPRVSNMATQ